MDPMAINEAADAFEGLMDESGLMPGDDAFDGPEGDVEAVAEAFEEELDSENEPEEAEDEPEDQGDEEDEADDEEAEPAEDPEELDESKHTDDSLFDITIDGEEYEVNLAELRSGYLRNEDFVKRSTELEAEYGQKLAEIAQREAELIREIEATAVINHADLTEYDKIDWNKLKAEDPATYQTKRLEYIDKKEAIQRQLQRRSQVQGMHQKAQEIKLEAYLQDQLKLAQKLIPEFQEEGFRAKMISYAESIGITEAEVSGITDARHLLLLNQARMYAESQLIKKNVIEKKLKPKELPQVVKPSAKAPRPTTEAKRQRALEEQFLRTGTISDAAKAFEAFV